MRNTVKLAGVVLCIRLPCKQRCRDQDLDTCAIGDKIDVPDTAKHSLSGPLGGRLVPGLRRRSNMRSRTLYDEAMPTSEDSSPCPRAGRDPDPGCRPGPAR